MGFATLANHFVHNRYGAIVVIAMVAMVACIIGLLILIALCIEWFSEIVRSGSTEPLPTSKKWGVCLNLLALTIQLGCIAAAVVGWVHLFVHPPKIPKGRYLIICFHTALGQIVLIQLFHIPRTLLYLRDAIKAERLVDVDRAGCV